MPLRPNLIVVDGLDGIGKGVIERALIEYEQKQGRIVFDTIAFSKAWERLPKLHEICNVPVPHYNTIVTAEPTYQGIGKTIREEIIERNGRDYPSISEIQSYSLDRLVLMKRLSIPALDAGLTDIRSRFVTATLCYQTRRAQDEGRGPEEIRNYILEQEGTQIELENAPGLLVIPTIKDAQEVINRIQERKKTQKDDKSIFDNLEFQQKLKPMYEDPWLRNLFEERKTVVAYLDAGISEQSTRDQAVTIYKSYRETGTVPEEYKTPEFA